MSKTKHTPGPWVVVPHIWTGGSGHLTGNGVFAIEDVAPETVICDRRTPWPEMAEVMQANAQLIAAAPTMLQALRRAALALAFAAEAWPAMQDDYQAVSDAIAKATGDHQ